eukprot:162093-Amphidinium_carterae.1
MEGKFQEFFEAGQGTAACFRIVDLADAAKLGEVVSARAVESVSQSFTRFASSNRKGFSML